VRQLLHEGERLVTPLEGLIWIAEHPQCKGCIGKAWHPGRREDQSVVLLGGIEDHCLFQVGTGRNQFSQPIQACPPYIVGHHEESRVLLALGQGETLLIQRTCALELPPVQIK
jgi:hypothetical protein